MKLIAETSIFSDQQVRDSFSEVRVTTEGIQQEVRGKVGNDEIISKINMSPEHIQIQSNRLEIDGTAVFNAIKPNIQNTLDGKKSIYTLKSGDAGGSNYEDILNFSAEGNIKTYTIDLSTPTTDIKAGDTVRLAYLAKDMTSPGNQGTIVYIIGTVQEDPTSPTSITLIGHGLDTTVIDGGHILTGTIDANRISGSVISAINESNTGEIDANKIKTSDIKIGDLNSILGGTNLLKEIGAKINTTKYCCATIPLIEQLVANQPYTLQLWGVSIFNTPSTDKSIDIYWGGDTIYLGRIDSFVDGYGSLTFTLSSSQITHSDTLHYYINFYNSNAELTSYNFNITKWKLEKSDAPTAWSASPSDRVGKSNILRGTNQMKTGAGTYGTATFSATQGTITHYNNDIGAITSGMLGYVAVKNYKNEPFEVGLSQKGIPAIYATVGLPYTISCWVKGNTEAVGAQVRLSPLQNAGSNPHTSRPALTTEWQYIFTTGVLTGTQSTSSIIGGFVTVPDMPAGGILYVMGLKVEQGSSPTAWSGGTETDANSYITDIDESGIIISSVNQNPSINAEGNSIKINGNGVYIYKNSIEQAHFIDSEVRLGESSKNNITIDTQGIHLYKIINNSITNIADFGDTIKIGIDNKQRIEINSTGFKGYDENNTSLLNISQNYISLGDVNAAHIIMSTINSTNPYIRMYNNTSICFDANKDSITIGNETNGRSVINASGLQVYLPTDLNHAVASFGSNTRIGYSTVLDQSYVYISKSGFWIYRKDEDRNRSLFTINPPYFTLGEDDNLRMSINTTKGYIHMYTKDSNDNLQLSFNANASGIYIGPTDSGHSSIKSDGLHVWTNTESIAANEVAFFGATARIGKVASNHISIDTTNGIQIFTGTESDSTNVAQFGSSIRIGKLGTSGTSKRNIFITDDAVQIRNNTTVLAEYGSSIKLAGNGATVTIGQTGTANKYNTIINSTGLTINNNNTAIASFGSINNSTQITVGKENESQVIITPTYIAMKVLPASTSSASIPVFEIKQTSTTVKSVRTYNMTFYGMGGIDDNVDFGRTISTWKSIKLKYTYLGETNEESYSAPPISDYQSGSYRFDFALNSGTNYDLYFGGTSTEYTDTIKLISVTFEFTTGQQLIQNTIGAYANTTESAPFRIGNGSSSSSTSNAFLVDWGGTGRFKGDIIAKCNTSSSAGINLTRPQDLGERRAEVSKAAYEYNALRLGRTIMLNVRLWTTTTIAAGVDIFDVTIAAPKPYGYGGFASGCAFFSGCMIGFFLYTTNNNEVKLRARNLGPGTLSNMSTTGSEAWGTLTYITAE